MQLADAIRGADRNRRRHSLTRLPRGRPAAPAALRLWRARHNKPWKSLPDSTSAVCVWPRSAVNR
ncbi:protein of unknown function [Bradyrhizobium sp. ORS 285]|nr:protein of unknown function [Bradyrhizobium sp. ORS 285]